MLNLKGLKVNLILEQITHHAKMTSPDYIMNYITYNLVIPRGYAPWRFLTPGFLANYFVKRSGMRCYYYDFFMSESFVVLDKLFSKNEIYHFNNGNNAYRYAYLPRSKRNKVIATYHQPPSQMYRFVTSIDHIKKLDSILVVGSSQIPYFEKIFPLDKIFQTSLATDTSFFSPKENRLRGKTCLFVGQHLRDFHTLKGIIEYINKIEKDIKFKIVTFKNNWSFFSNTKNTELFTNLGEEEFREQYQESDIFLLPLLDCTGICAVVEAMASGLPIITNDIGSIRDYANDSCALFFKKGDSKSMAEAVLELISDEQRLQKMAAASRAMAVSKFEWRVVAEKLAKIYQTISEF